MNKASNIRKLLSLPYKPTWLCDGAGLLEAVAGLVVPELDAAVVPAANSHAVLVHRQRVDRGVVATEVLQKPVEHIHTKTFKIYGMLLSHISHPARYVHPSYFPSRHCHFLMLSEPPDRNVNSYKHKLMARGKNGQIEGRSRK